MSSNDIGSGIIYHSCNDETKSYEIKSSEDSADKVIKFCDGFNHIVLLKENGFIQKIASNDTMFDESYKYLQQFKIPIIDIAFGKKHGIALTEDYKVCSFGDNTYGQLGIGHIGNIDNEISIQPQFINYFMQVNQKIIEIKCGSHHSCALSKSGDVYTWGQGKYGQLGTKVLSIQILPRYVHIAFVANKKDFIQRIECGPEGTAAISKSGNLYQWGYGQPTPVQIALKYKDNNMQISKISIGFAHSLCLTSGSKLYGWGLCLYGQLGVDALEKKVTKPLYLKQFANDIVSDIKCCGLYSVICTENNGIYILGFNDCLFEKKQHINPFKIRLTDRKIKYIGCGRYDFAVITATDITTIKPSVCCSNGSNIEIAGHGFYATAFEPTVKFVLPNNVKCIIDKATFVDNGILSATTPNINDINNISYPCKITVSVAMDGKYYSDPCELYLIENPDDKTLFNITPNCADINGDIKCILSDKNESNYIEMLTNFVCDLQLEHINIRVKLKNDVVYILDAVLNINNNSIEFVIPSMDVGRYDVFIAFDGQQFVNTNTNFIVYNVECIECKPENYIILSQCTDTETQLFDLEMKVTGFVANNARQNNKLKFVSENDEKDEWFICDYIYESQSARDIVENDEKMQEMYTQKRAENTNNKENELKELIASRKEKDEEREKWLTQTEKDRKKKKKPADIQAFEEQVNKVNDEWKEILKERENEIRQIERKYKKEMLLIHKQESKIVKEEEKDNGEGYIKCNINISKFNQWTRPNNIQIKITSNNISYSDLYSIQLINPQIKQISPSIGLFSQPTKIEMFIDGFVLNNDDLDKNDIKIFIQDTKEKIIEIEECKINADENVISFTISNLSSFGEKRIVMKYKQLFEINTHFLACDNFKISGVTPNTFAINEVSKMKIEFSNEINTKYIDGCYVKIHGNEKSLLVKGIISENGKYIETEFDSENNSLQNIGVTKKAQIEISFNNQQWIKAKQTISIK